MTLLGHHAQELYQDSGIAPAVAAARGCRSVSAGEAAALGFAPSQCRDGLFLPTFSLAGVRRFGMLKPDAPRTDENGKRLKYEWPAGVPPVLDCHPDALTALKAPGVAKWWGEGQKKGDSAWTRGLPFVNLPGVWAFVHHRLVVADLDEVPIDGETHYVCFDSDVVRKPEVAEALYRFCHALHRRGGQVFVVYLPEGVDGAKVGIDDFFVSGNTVEDVKALAKPWGGTGPGVWLRASTGDDADTLRRERDESRRDVAAIVAMLNNPALSRNELLLASAVLSEARAKAARGGDEPDGRVVLSAPEISDDWRPKPPPGERWSEVNPTNGRRPRMARDKVGPLMTAAIEAGIIEAEARPAVRPHAGGTWYRTTEWLVTPPPSVAAALRPWIDYGNPVPRKPREAKPCAPCPECGGFHDVVRRDYCIITGSAIGKPRVVKRRGDSGSIASDNLAEARNDAENRDRGDELDTDSAPLYLLSANLSEVTVSITCDGNGHAADEDMLASAAVASWDVHAEREQ